MIFSTSELSQTLASVVESEGASVVRVEGRRHAPTSGTVFSADGLIVTAHHALESDEGISVGLPDGKSVPATLVGRDPSTDLALLRADLAGLRAPAWAETKGLKVGHFALALARPGRSVRATLGIVSALGGAWRTPLGGEMDSYLESDLGLAPGFSGGPLLDTGGQLLGMATSSFTRYGTVAIPSRTVTRVVEALRTHGGIRRAYLGVGAYPVRIPPALRERTGADEGLILLSVEPDGPADRAGIAMGDTLLALDGNPVGDVQELLNFLGPDKVGKSVAVKALRAGEVREFSVAAAERR